MKKEKKGTRLEWVLGMTWLRSRNVKGTGDKATIAWTAWAAMTGTALGVAAMVVSLAVMNGYRSNLVRVMASAFPHLSVEWDGKASPEQSQQREEKLREWLESGYKVRDVSRYISKETVLSGPRGISGVLMRGLNASEIADDKALLKLIDTESASQGAGGSQEATGQFALKLGETAADGTKQIWFSRSIGSRLGVKLGEQIKVLDVQSRDQWLPSPNPLRLRVTGWLDTGVSAFDDLVVVVELSTLRALFPSDTSGAGLGLKLEKPLRSNGAAQLLRDRLIYQSAYVYSWLESNQQLFKLIKIQKVALFLVLFLIVAVALFGMTGTLSMLVSDKKREIAVLSALGISSQKIQRAFIFQGLLIGSSGLILGMGVGLAICGSFSRLTSLKLPPGIYPGSDQVPILLLWQDCLGVALAVMIASILGAYLPAKQAAATDIIQVIHSQ